MGTFVKHLILSHASLSSSSSPGHRRSSGDRAPSPGAGPAPARASRRWAVASTVLAAAAALHARRPAAPPPAEAAEMAWGTRSFIKEKYFQPGLSPEEAAARIRHTAEGLRDMRHMLDTMSWRYVLFYVRLKAAYLDADLKNALATVPEGRRASYIKTANEVVDNMSELDRYVRTPKVYESYLYYEKTLKSLDELITFLA
ncbi:Photosynthetic NDH subunit of lumenal location 2, chloroplastic [Ananas comosus]|uniref:Photosynthetic NDH subunit of lumenal location 2, chloroplastic n=1 Tax=Ananas comosus TaxID=4615 RepID=A0A199V096_ANACO|nr:Photosynthetic NDH subunit of lumenal location 2, chloroplastic [Ananas comosus]